MSETRTNMVADAARLVEQLRTPEVNVSRSVWLSLLAGFMIAPGDLARARDAQKKLLDLLLSGNGGHLKRGHKHEQEVRLAARVVVQAFESHQLDLTGFRQLFGWTARLLQVRATAPRARHKETRPDDTDNTKRGGFGLGTTSLGQLAALKKKLKGGS